MHLVKEVLRLTAAGLSQRQPMSLEAGSLHRRGCLGPWLDRRDVCRLVVCVSSFSSSQAFTQTKRSLR